MLVRLATTGPLGPNDFVRDASGRQLQVCRAAVVGDAGDHRIALFNAVFPEEAAISLRSLATVLAKEPLGTLGAVVRGSAKGTVRLEIHRESESAALVVAAAAAVMHAALSWDESPLIRVGVNGVCFRIVARFSNQEWTASAIARDAV